MNDGEYVWEQGARPGARAAFVDLLHQVPRPKPRTALRGGTGVTALFGLVLAGSLLLTQLVDTTGPWVSVGTADEITHVRYVKALNAYIVPTDPGFLALSARDPHLREPISFCQPSQWFQDTVHGSMYTRYGYYRQGPSPRGMDRLGSKIENGKVYVTKTIVERGPARDAGGPPQDPEGPFCVSSSL
jgi:hypothetical protein